MENLEEEGYCLCSIAWFSYSWLLEQIAGRADCRSKSIVGIALELGTVELVLAGQVAGCSMSD